MAVHKYNIVLLKENGECWEKKMTKQREKKSKIGKKETTDLS